MRIKFRKAQALMELAIGMLAFALVISALIAFSDYIVKGLKLHQEARSHAGVSAVNSASESISYSSYQKAENVDVDPIAAEYIFGSKKVNIKEQVYIPKAGILKEQP